MQISREDEPEEGELEDGQVSGSGLEHDSAEPQGISNLESARQISDPHEQPEPITRLEPQASSQVGQSAVATGSFGLPGVPHAIIESCRC